MNRQQIRKGASIVAGLELERLAIAKDLKQDVRYYSRHKGCERTSWFRRAMFNNRYKKQARRTLKPTLANLARAIANISYDLATSDYSHMSCGWQDHYGEVEDRKAEYRRRLVIAYRYLSWKARH